jgi:hypothetical protein
VRSEDATCLVSNYPDATGGIPGRAELAPYEARVYLD